MTEGPKWTDVAIVILTIGIVFFALMQWLEMRGSGHQTDQLVNYAKAQADAASDQADAAQQFSDTAEDINSRISDAVEQLESSANTAKASIRATQDAMRLDQRAWIGMAALNITDDIAKGTVPKADVWIVNTGKTPAIHTETKGQALVICGDFPKSPRYNIPGGKLSHAMLMPNQPVRIGLIDLFSDVALDDKYIAAIRKSPCDLYVYDRITYLDVFKRPHWRHQCEVWDKDTPKTFNVCSVYNDGDEDYPDGKEPN
jgi:hypothetical protein